MLLTVRPLIVVGIVTAPPEPDIFCNRYGIISIRRVSEGDVFICPHVHNPVDNSIVPVKIERISHPIHIGPGVNAQESRWTDDNLR